MPSQLLTDSRRNHAAHLRMRQKRSTWKLLGGAVLLALAACGSDTGSTDDSETSQGGGKAGSAATPPTAATSSNKPADSKSASNTSTPAKSQSNTPPAAASGSNMSGSANSANGAGSKDANSAPSNMSAATPPASGSSSTPPAAGTMDPMMAASTPGSKPADPGADTPVEVPELTGTPTLYWLEIGRGTVTKAAADGSDAKVVASGSPLSAPDGITVDPEGKHFFVLNMGTVIGGGNSGSLVRYDLDGSNPMVIMKPGSMADGETFNTGKQVTIDRVNKKLYLGDREGTKVWRCDYDGANLEVLVSGHGVNQIVGVAADPTKRQFYFSDRNGLKLFRAGMDMPAGETHADRKDVELLYVEKSPNAMPLDLELDIKNRMIYWTDRNQNKVFGMGMDIPAGSDPMTRTDVKTIASNLTQAIGLGLDHENGVLYVTHGGSVSMVKTDGSGLKQIGSGGSTGIHFTKIP